MALTFGVFTPANSNGAAVLNMVSGGWRSGWRRHDVSQRQYQAVLDKGFTAFAVRHGSSPKFVIRKIVPDVRRACGMSGSTRGGCAWIRTGWLPGAGAPAVISRSCSTTPPTAGTRHQRAPSCE